MKEAIEAFCLGSDWRSAIMTLTEEIEALKAAQAVAAAPAPTATTAPASTAPAA